MEEVPELAGIGIQHAKENYTPRKNGSGLFSIWHGQIFSGFGLSAFL